MSEVMGAVIFISNLLLLFQRIQVIIFTIKWIFIIFYFKLI